MVSIGTMEYKVETTKEASTVDSILRYTSAGSLLRKVTTVNCIVQTSQATNNNCFISDLKALTRHEG